MTINNNWSKNDKTAKGAIQINFEMTITFDVVFQLFN